MPNKNPGRTESDSSQGIFSGDDSAPEEPVFGDEDLAKLSRKMLITLGRTIENDVIPRLMLSLQSPTHEDNTARNVAQIAGDSIDEFVHLVLHHDAPVATKYVSTLRASGVPLASMYLNLLAPAARKLGEMWEEDECSFTDVTVGVCRMHQVLLEFTRCFDAAIVASDSARNALILPAHGEQHTFGLFMVMEFLRRGGWDCFSGTPQSNHDFETLVNGQQYGAIGISVSADRHIGRATEQARWIRKHSRNRDCLLLVGGRSIQANPALVDEIGADGTAADAHETAILIDRLMRDRQATSAT